MRVDLPEKLTHEWQSGDVPLVEESSKDPQSTGGVQRRARSPMSLNETGKARTVNNEV